MLSSLAAAILAVSSGFAIVASAKVDADLEESTADVLVFNLSRTAVEARGLRQRVQIAVEADLEKAERGADCKGRGCRRSGFDRRTRPRRTAG